MFQFPTSPSCTLWIHVQVTELLSLPGFPIRKSVLLQLFAPSHSLSQLVTSFFGSWCQGIHPTLLVAWPFFWFSSLVFSKLSLSLSRIFSRYLNLSVKDWVLRCFHQLSLRQYTLLWCITLPFFQRGCHAFNGCAFFVFSFFHKIISLFSFQGTHRIELSSMLWKFLSEFLLVAKLIALEVFRLLSKLRLNNFVV